MVLTEEFYTTALVFGGAFATALWFTRWRTSPKPGGRVPPSLRSVPFLGSLPFFPGFDKFHAYLADQSKILGKVFSLTLFDKYTVVLNGKDEIHDALVKHSFDFASRPSFFLDTILNTGRHGIVQHPYDAHFKKYHQLSLSILKKFGFGQGIMERRIRREVEELLDEFGRSNGKAINPTQLTVTSVLNVIVSIIFGKRYPITDPKLEKVITIVRNMALEVVDPMMINFFPFLRYLPKYKRVIQECLDRDEAMNGLLEEGIQESLSGMTEESFISCFVQEGGPDYDHKQLLLTLRDLFLAGTETTATTLQWFLSYMANNPGIQKRLQEEIDAVVPRSRFPSLEDKSKLTYVEATTLELMRIKTIVPMALPHLTMCDTEVAGYFIPANCFVIPNLYGVHMDPELWPEPDKFCPDRFIDDAGSIIKKEFVIPFSLGRRSCLGEVLARQEIFLFITGILQQYDIRPPENQDRVDVKEVVGVTITPTPYEVRLLKRN